MSNNMQVYVCGREEVIQLSFNPEDYSQAEVLWCWSAETCPNLPASYAEKFNSTDECKPMADGKQVLITSSTGAFALVDYNSLEALSYGEAANAHSADVLPNNRIVVAASHAKHNAGDKLLLFDIGSENVIWEDHLPWAHGVVWDNKQQLLWALGDEEVRLYSLKGWEHEPSLALIKTISLPESGGHDMHFLQGEKELSISTAMHCWILDAETHDLRPFPGLEDKHHIKCIAQNPETGTFMLVQASDEHWWSDSILFPASKQSYQVPGERFYKARWC